MAANASDPLFMSPFTHRSHLSLVTENPSSPKSQKQEDFRSKEKYSELEYICAEARDAKLWFAEYLAFETPRCSKKQAVSCA